jgi:hypothetical protein
MTDETITLSFADLCSIYACAYHAGHHDTVESRYTDVLAADYDSYHAEAVREILDNP